MLAAALSLFAGALAPSGLSSTPPDATLRDAGPDDLPALREFVARLSLAARVQRFFAPVRELPPEIAQALARRDPAHRFVLVEHGREIVALGQYAVAADAPRCEVALVVADGWQSQGLGRRLLEALLAQAARAGLREAVLMTASTNRAMGRLARTCGFSLARDPEDAGLLHGRLAL